MRSFAFLVAASCLPMIAAWADEPVTRRAGQWQITILGRDGKTEPPDKFCYPGASIADVTKGMGNCTRHDVHTAGIATTIDAVCSKDGKRQATFHITITAPSDTAYHAEMHVAYSPPIGSVSSVDTVQDGKWLGPCPAGEKPTD